MTWTVLRADVLCGRCQQSITAGDPVGLLTARALRRCVDCADVSGFEVDHVQVDAARQAIDAEDAARRDAPVPVSYAKGRREDGFTPLAAIPAPQPPTKFHDLPATVRRQHALLADND